MAHVEIYTRQLRALEQYTKAHAQSADARFVLAYQYMTASHEDAALRHEVGLELRRCTTENVEPENVVSTIRTRGGSRDPAWQALET